MEDTRMHHHDKAHCHYMYHYVYIMPSMPHMPSAVLPGIHTPAMPMPTSPYTSMPCGPSMPMPTLPSGPCMPMPSMPSMPTAPAMDYYDCYPPKRD